MTPEQHLTDTLEAAGIPYLARRLTSPPAVFPLWGGTGGDEGLVQGAAVVVCVVSAGDDVSKLLGPVWRALHESDDYIPLSVQGETTIPGTEGHAVRESVITLDTTYQWWADPLPV